MAVARVRLARLEDAARCMEIYRPAIEKSAASFEMEVPTVEAFVSRMERVLETHPWLVGEAEDSTVLGYAYASEFRARKAYQWSTEISLYIDSSAQGKGVGRTLYTALFDCLRLQGYGQLVAGMTLPNDASVGIHAAMGFEDVGSFKSIGGKFGQFHDVKFMQMELQALDPASSPPPTPLASCREAIEACLATHPRSPKVPPL